MLKFVGRGSCFNTKEGNTSAFYKKRKNMLLIDCGSDVFSRLINKNILKDIDILYTAITHFHTDHVGSLSNLIFYMFYIKKQKVKILIPQSDNYSKTTSKYVHSLMTMLEIQGVSPNFYELIPANVYIPELAMKIFFNPVDHIPEYLSHSLTITTDDQIIWYSGDCNYVCPVPEVYNLIYQEVSFFKSPFHCHVDDLVKYKTHKEKVYLMHIDDSKRIQTLIDLGFNVVEIE